MKNCLSKSSLATHPWCVRHGNAWRKDFETGVVKISQLKKFSALIKSHKLTKQKNEVGR